MRARWGHLQRALLVLVLIAGGIGPALAHASMIGSRPENGSVVADPPAAVILTFNEAVRLLAASLVDSDGTRIEIAPTDATASGTGIAVPLPAMLRSGSYALNWRAASGDGHPIAGTLVFAVGTPSGVVAAAEKTDPLVRPLLWAARAAMLIGLLLGAASSSFRTVAPSLPPVARRISLAILPVGALAVVLSVPLQGLDALGRPLSDFAAPDVWQTAMATGYGGSAIAALIALAAGAISIGLHRPAFAGMIAVVSLGAIGLAASLSGHASSADPRWLMRTMVFIHVAAVAWWAGDLLPLALALRVRHTSAHPPLLRFSRFIPFVLVPLIVSGLTLTAVQLGPPGPAWLTPYGYILAGKLALVSALLAVAAMNRWLLTAPVVSGEDAAVRRMRRAILVEVVLISLIVGLAAGWRFTPPPRAVAASLSAEAAGATIVLADETIRAELVVAPALAGPNTVTVDLLDSTGQSATVRQLSLSFANSAAGIAEIEVPLLEADGRWSAETVLLPVAGDWQIEVTVRISDFELTRMEGGVAIGS